jgi:hypothetical protein
MSGLPTPTHSDLPPMEDPIEDIIVFVKKWLNKIRLSFLNEDEIIGQESLW